MDYSEIQAMALELGITALRDVDLAGLEHFSNGCSGGLSWAYGLMGKQISCHKVCVAHDYLYIFWGGGEKNRKKADTLLRISAARSGSFPAGWRGVVLHAWRNVRAWCMYAAVRIFAGRYWEK